MKFNYYVDKETKNTYRFQPDEAATELLGQATIYIKKSALPALGINDIKAGITLEIGGTTDVISK